MTPMGGHLVLGLAQRSARGRPGRCASRAAAMPGARPRVSGSGDPDATIVVHDQRTWSAVLRRGSRGMAESYIAGWWDTDDLTAVVRVAFRRTTALRQFLDATARRSGGLVAAAQRLRPPSQQRDRENIAAHYDLSNEFFALMLDPTMAYSCGFFAEDDTSLEAAQVAKFEMIAAKLQLGPDDHVIEIGTGWGGFAIHAAAQHGCRVTTTTISEAQRSLAEKRVAEHGLADRVTVLGEDYRDLQGRYDALVSIEMIEAVDWRRHDQFFATCARLLTDRGTDGVAGDHDRGRQLRAGEAARRLHPRHGLPRRMPAVGQHHRRIGRPHLESADRRPAGHRPALRRDAPALARQPGGPACRGRAPRLRRALLAVLDPLPLLLRSGVHGAPRVRRATRPGPAGRPRQAGGRQSN